MNPDKTYSIRQLSARFDLPASTLRYYEEQGLLPEVARNKQGQRIYTQTHVDRLNAIRCFKDTGLPLGKIREFFEYEKQLACNIDKILDIVTTHEQDIQRQLEEMRQNLAHIHQKVLYYNAVKKACETHAPLPCFDDFAPTADALNNSENPPLQIALGTRTAETAALYFHKTNNDAIRRYLPQKAKTAEEAVRDYEQTLLPEAASYGRTILCNGQYIGDIWCYCIRPDDTPNAMVSYCIFETACHGRGIATRALRLFLDEITAKYRFRTVGAFTFSENIASVRVLEKNGFVLTEEFSEDGAASGYYQLTLPD